MTIEIVSGYGHGISAISRMRKDRHAEYVAEYASDLTQYGQEFAEKMRRHSLKITTFDLIFGDRAEMGVEVETLAARMRDSTERWRASNALERESEGKVDADPWFRMLHWQAMLAGTWVEQHASKAIINKVHHDAYRRP